MPTEYFCEVCDQAIAERDVARARFYITSSGRMFCRGCANKGQRVRWAVTLALGVAVVGASWAAARSAHRAAALIPEPAPAPEIDTSALDARLDRLGARVDAHDTRLGAPDPLAPAVAANKARLDGLARADEATGASIAELRKALLTVPQQRTVELSDPRVRKIVRKLYQPDPAARVTAVAELLHVGTPEAAGQLILALADPDQIVRAMAARSLGKLDGVSGIAALITLLRDEAPSVRTEARGALRRLSGREFGFRPEGKPAERDAAIGRWRTWWREGAPRPERDGDGENRE